MTFKSLLLYFMNVAPVASVATFATPTPNVGAATPAAASPAEQAVQVGDTAKISVTGKQWCQAEELGALLFMALLASDDKKKKESSLLAEMAIGLLALRALAETSPHISISMENGQAVYQLTGNVTPISEATMSLNMNYLFSGGVASMAAALFSGPMV